MRDLGVLEFQLVLLRRMADFQPDLVDATRRELGVTATRMREVNALWQRLLRSRSAPRGADRYAMVLGPPPEVARRTAGALSYDLHRWRLPLWPELRFEIVIGPGGVVWQEWLVRPDDAPAPRLSRIADLTPWSCVVGDVERSFPGARHRTPDPPSRWATDLTVPDADGVPRAVCARFVWGLLQEIDVGVIA